MALVTRFCSTRSSRIVSASISAGLDSRVRGADLSLRNASRRLEMREAHMEPSVSSFRCKPPSVVCAGCSGVSPDWDRLVFSRPGPISGGVINEFAITFASGTEKPRSAGTFPCRLPAGRSGSVGVHCMFRSALLYCLLSNTSSGLRRFERSWGDTYGLPIILQTFRPCALLRCPIVQSGAPAAPFIPPQTCR